MGRIIKNTGVLFISQFITYILGFFYIIYAAHYLGTASYGILAFALAFNELLAVFMDLGLSTLLVREVSKYKNLTQKYLSNVIFIKFILVLITLVLLVLIVNYLEKNDIIITVTYLIGLSVALNAYSSIFFSIFQAYEKMEYRAVGLILNSSLMVIGALLVIYFKLDVLGFAFIYLIANMMLLAYCLIICSWKFIVPKIEIDLTFWKDSLKEALPMGGMAVFIMIYFRIDTVMLSFMAGDTATGLYSAAYRLSEATTIIPTVFVTSIFPVLSQFFVGSKSSFLKTYEKSVKYMFYLSLIVAMIITVLADPIILLLFGPDFLGAATALKILIWSAAIMYVTMIQGNTIIAINKQKFSLILTILMAIFNIILNLILIPPYSYIGSSLATVITEASGFVIGLYLLSRWGYSLKIFNTFLVPILSLIVSGSIFTILSYFKINIILITACTCLVYIAMIYKLGMEADDKMMIKNVFKYDKLTFKNTFK